MDTKQCTTCLNISPVTEFYRKKNGQSMGATCKQCSKQRVMIWRKTSEGRLAAQQADARYKASPQGQQKRRAYSRSETARNGEKRYRHTLTGQEALRRYRQSDKRKAVLHRYYQSGKGKVAIARYQATPKGKASLARGVHKRRGSMLIASTVTAEEWAIIKGRAKNKCYYCQQKMQRLTMDHIIPLSKGGQHIASNIVPACRSCNSRKGNKILHLI